MTIGDSCAILPAILAGQGEDVPTIGPHHGAAAGKLMLRKLGAQGLLGGPMLKLVHPSLKVTIEHCLLPTKFIGINDNPEHPLALT
jgi:hypothetical protein